MPKFVRPAVLLDTKFEIEEHMQTYDFSAVLDLKLVHATAKRVIGTCKSDH